MHTSPLFPLTLTETNLATEQIMPKRLSKYRRTPQAAAALKNRRITDCSRDIIANLSYYSFLPSSSLVRLVAGNERIIYRHLQMLYHKGLVNRFAFPSNLNPSEFNYYLDNPAALELLLDAGWAEPQQLDFARVRYHREKQYDTIHFQAERQGSLLYLNHELDISRFHFMLEMACRASDGAVELADWQQGPSLWHSVTAPKVGYDEQRDLWGEQEATEKLPHRPDAFFTLHFPTRPADKAYEHFFYERERKTTTDRKRIVKKLRAHFQYIVKQRLHKTDYGIDSIRAVLVETPDPAWAQRLQESSAHPLVSGAQPSPLFWFTASTHFLTPTNDKSAVGRNHRPVPRYLMDASAIFAPLWTTAVDSSFHSLLDVTNS